MPVVDPSVECRIFAKNFVDSNSVITLSHGGTAEYLYDRDIDSPYKATAEGGNRDTDLMTIDITFMQDGVETAFYMGAIALLEHNWKEWTFKYKNESGAYVTAIQVTAGAVTYNVYTFGNVRTSRVRFEVQKTIHPNQFKEIGELIVSRQRFVIERNPDSIALTYREKVRTLELGNGERHRAYTRFSRYRTQKWGARISWSFLTDAQMNVFRVLKDEGEPFLLYLESVTRPKELYLVNWVNALNERYTIQYKYAGKSLDMEVEEV